MINPTRFFCALLLGICASPLLAQDPPDFEQVAPLLRERCVLCHNGPAAPLGLHLDSLTGVLKGSERGVVVKAGNAEESELIRRVKGISQPRMPMTGPPWLSEAEIALLEGWVEGGLRPGSATNPAQADALSVTPMEPGSSPPPDQPLTADAIIDYSDVAPILATRCAKCHTANGLLGPAPEGFRLDAYATTLAFDDRARVVPGQPGASELLRRIKGQARPRMPFDGPPWLSDTEVALIERWIAQGARDSSGAAAAVPIGAEVRLHGTLTAADEIDGWRFERNPGMRIDKNPQPGSYVQLRGTLAADGNVQAERLRRR